MLLTPQYRFFVLPLSLCVCSLALQGCGPLFNLNIKVLGEQTSLENQVLGSYATLGNELLAYSSVRGVEPDGSLRAPKETTESQKQVFAALQNRRYNSDDIQRLLIAGIVGETNQGTLEIRKDPPRDFPFTREQVEQLVAEENSDRAILLNRLNTTVVSDAPNREEEIRWVFATINQEIAPQGSPLQNRAGDWSTK